MKNIKKLYSLAIASIALILFLILVISTASASITATRISSGDVMSNPDIYSNRIIWQDYQNGHTTTHIFDLSTKNETLINLTGEDPSIYGSKLVYRIGTPPGGNIYLYDLGTKKEIRVNSYPDWAQNHPVIDGNIVVWEDQRNYINNEDWQRFLGDIYMYNISTKKETKIANTGSSPSIYSNKIVWDNMDYYLTGKGDIYMYDLSTKKTTQISHNGSGVQPSIYSNKIVWQDNRKGNWDIYMYDLSTKKETQITTNSSDSTNPVIYGNNIVWEDNRNGNYDIYAYDLITHQQVHTTEQSDQSNPAIYNNKITWIDRNTYAKDNFNNGITITGIFAGTISYLPVANFSASPTSGKHPLKVQFTDQSTDEYYYSWNFGDNSQLSTLENPVHTYTTAGKYTVKLTVKNAAGSNTKTMSITVT